MGLGWVHESIWSVISRRRASLEWLPVLEGILERAQEGERDFLGCRQVWLPTETNSLLDLISFVERMVCLGEIVMS